MKEAIREFALGLGVDDIGFSSVADYHSPNSPAVEALFPGARSMVVMAYRETSACESPSAQMAMSGRLDVMEFIRSTCYRVTRHLEVRFGTPAMAVPVSYPMDFVTPGKGATGELSLRHAAVAAGMGAFGMHNLVVHPRFGTRVIFAAVITALDLPSDPPLAQNPCTECGLCREACPTGALNDEGKTSVVKCLSNSQPYGVRGSISFWSRFSEASPEERKAMLKSPEYLSLYQAGSVGFQYYCFRCLAVCPVGVTPRIG